MTFFFFFLQTVVVESVAVMEDTGWQWVLLPLLPCLFIISMGGGGKPYSCLHFLSVSGEINSTAGQQSDYLSKEGEGGKKMERKRQKSRPLEFPDCRVFINKITICRGEEKKTLHFIQERVACGTCSRGRMWLISLNKCEDYHLWQPTPPPPHTPCGVHEHVHLI